MAHNISLGRRAEIQAADFLKRNGYKILKMNYRTPMGEIDIVASDAQGLAFVEVKASASRRFGLPAERVSSLKQKQISKAALNFLKENGLLESRARFDVVSALYSEEGAPEFELVKNAFDLDPHFSP